jgi:hypothetical protein
MIDYSDAENVIERCFTQLQTASREKYDTEEADKTAALFLVAQMKLSFIIEDIELKAKNAKNEIERIEGEKYFEFKTTNSDKKTTENMLVNYVSKSPDIVNAKKECATQEANLKKYLYILNALKDGHIYFRNLSKSKTWAE